MVSATHFFWFFMKKKFTNEEIGQLIGKMAEKIRDEIVEFARENLSLSNLIGVIDSPIKGTDGNREFLFGIKN